MQCNMQEQTVHIDHGLLRKCEDILVGQTNCTHLTLERITGHLDSFTETFAIP